MKIYIKLGIISLWAVFLSSVTENLSSQNNIFRRVRGEIFFRVGGVNSQAAIENLTELDGVPIKTLEERMRPGRDAIYIFGI